MKPQIGDMVHFRSVCAACNKVGRLHFTFVIDDPDLLAVLPEFSKRIHTYNNEGHKIYMWWDHSPSISEMYKINIDAFINTLKLIVWYRERHGYEDTYLILLHDDQVFLTGPSRNILPLTRAEVSNVKISQIADRTGITHFNYVDLTASQSVDNFIRLKQSAVLDVVMNSIAEKRKQLGLSQLMDNSALGRAALSMSESLLTDEHPQVDLMQLQYQQRTESFDYHGLGVGLTWYRKVWPTDTSNNAIAQDILDMFMPTIVEDWEEFGLGISRGVDDNDPGQFCMCLVLGVGADGSAIVTNHINEERVKMGLRPLESDYYLRRLVRDYVAIHDSPDESRISIDIEQSGYVKGMSRFRCSYGRTVTPLPPVDQGKLSFHELHELGRLAASEVLRTKRESLFRSDWQDVGFALTLGHTLTSADAVELSIVTDCVLAWRMPPNTERPAHFPPPIDEP